MGYLSLLKKEPRTLGFGFLNTFISGLGQTHFVALFSPMITTHFSLSATEYGSLYSLVTLVSGFVIVFVGPYIDKWDIRKLSFSIGLGLIASLLIILPLSNLLAVCLGLFGLRFFGQGLGSSISSISVARFFNDNRGKALSLSQLGFPVYEGLITPLAALMMAMMSFENYIIALCIPVALIFLPLSLNLTRKIPSFNFPTEIKPTNTDTPVSHQKSWTRKEVFTHLQVYFLIPQTLMPPFALTGLFFHQAIIAEQKGWTLSLMASGLFFFAIGRIINTFLTGPLVDKHSAKILFPFYQIPLALGFLVLAAFDGLWVPALSFALCGLSVGSGGPIKSAIWAELYGIKHLGAIKSMFATLMILSTSVSPILFGWILDNTSHPANLLIGLTSSSLAAAFLSWLSLCEAFKSNPSSPKTVSS